jgi:hypothetical protein
MKPKDARSADQNSNNVKWLPIILCSLFGLLGVAYAFILRFSGFISTETAFFGFTCLFIFTAIVIYALPQLEEFAFGGWKMTLREAEKRIYAKEQIVQDLMLTLADLSAMDSLNMGRLGPSGELAVVMRQWREERIETILELVNATPEQRLYLKRYVPIYQGLDDAFALPVPAPDRQQAAAPHAERLIAQLRSEIGLNSQAATEAPNQ